MKNPQKSTFSAGPENSRTFGANSPHVWGKFPHVWANFPHVSANSRTFRENSRTFPENSRAFRFSGVFSFFRAFFTIFSDFAISQCFGGHTLQNCKPPKFLISKRFEDNFSQMTHFDACRPYLAAFCNMRHGDGTPYSTMEHVWRYGQSLNVVAEITEKKPSGRR